MSKLYLVIDLEATCWEKIQGNRKESEIIEIGAVLYDKDLDMVEKEFQTFVKPVRNIVLSDFCTELTSIRQEQVDAAPVFPEAMKHLREEILDCYRVLFCSWGDYDRNQFKKDCKYHKIKYPFGKKHLNIKRLFAKRKHCKCGISGALRMLYMEFQGAHHRAIDDARNVVRILRTLRPLL